MTLVAAIALVAIVGVVGVLVAAFLHANVACAGDALVAQLDVDSRASNLDASRVDLDLSPTNVDLMIAHLDW